MNNTVLKSVTMAGASAAFLALAGGAMAQNLREGDINTNYFGNVALDGAGANSPFTAALVKGLREPGRNLTSVMIDVRKDVLAVTAGKLRFEGPLE